ncbi:hypothetical protein Tsubulata_012127 [Turnera subulata]|uniref:Uncharacterized protein n=1 Tax=Turnera subulata TaxID=218843 RepID=A0A9Q0FFN1_9ROSI|nr:hypothetical protein Tsubulata_012127 [Turnera subulata]
MASSHHLSLAAADTGTFTSVSADANGSGFFTAHITLVASVTESFSSLATGDADPSEEMVLGQPEPFNGDEVSRQSRKLRFSRESDSIMLRFTPQLKEHNHRYHQLPSASADAGSSSSAKTSVVLGRPLPFNGNNALKKRERLKDTKYGELYLMAMELKPKSFGSSNCRDAMKFPYYNHGPGASMYNGTFFLSLARRRENAIPVRRGRHPNSSDGTDTLYSKVELPGIYGDGVKMWVKSESVVVNSMDLKSEDACSEQEGSPELRIDKDGAEIDNSLAVTLVFTPKMRE